MHKRFAILFLFLAIFATPLFVFAAVQALFDGQSDDYIYMLITLDDLSNIKTPQNPSGCKNFHECPQWTALIWDGENPETIKYAGAIYNTSDGLSQGMTFPQTQYDVLEIIGLDIKKEPAASAISDMTWLIPSPTSASTSSPDQILQTPETTPSDEKE